MDAAAGGALLPSVGDDGPYNGTICAVGGPCLFDVLADPLEKHDVAQSNPAVVSSMQARLLELLSSEVTVAESGLCPTSEGTKNDPRGAALAKATGFWQPWLNNDDDDAQQV